MQTRLVLPVSMAFAAIFGAGFANLVPTSMVFNEVRPAPRVLDQHQTYPSDMMFVEAPATDLSPDIAIGPDYYLGHDDRDYLIPAGDIGQGREGVTRGELEPRENHAVSPNLQSSEHEILLAEPSQPEEDSSAWNDAPVVAKAPVS